MKIINYFEDDLYGTWAEIQETRAATHVYRGFDNLNWDGCFFAINFVRKINELGNIKNYDKILISCHFQTFDVPALLDFFENNKNKKILFLIDQNIDISDYSTLSSIFPNVTIIPWITWHHQLDSAIKWHGIADSPGCYSKKISCLSGRQDLHKIIVTAFLIHEFEKDQYLCSYLNQNTADAYWLKNDFYLPDRLKSLLNGFLEKNTKIFLDDISDKSGPNFVFMSNWKYPAFRDCAINLCLESQFNDVTDYRGIPVRIPGPMFTEKTWKPLLAGQSFLPVGQFRSCQVLKNYGIRFDLGLNLDFDEQSSEFTRLEKIIDVLSEIKDIDAEELKYRCTINADWNLETIKSREFFNLCEKHNQASLALINNWIKQ